MSLSPVLSSKSGFPGVFGFHHTSNRQPQKTGSKQDESKDLGEKRWESLIYRNRAEGQQGHKKPRASFCFATNLKQTIISDLFVQKKDGILLLFG